MSKLPIDIYNHLAVISDCGRYRYWLKRILSRPGLFMQPAKPCVFIMLNPSTADHEQDDPTIRRCINYARDWGYDELIVVNLFALRSPDPESLYQSADPVGPLNNQAIEAAIDYAHRHQGIVICAWGNDGGHLNRSTQVREMLSDVPLHCLKINGGSGEPGHPLYLKKNLQPVPLNKQAVAA